MVHVEDMSAPVAFYEALGAELLHGSRDGDLAMLRIGSSQLSLLAHPPNPDQDEGFGRRLQLRTPDGLLVSRSTSWTRTSTASRDAQPVCPAA